MRLLHKWRCPLTDERRRSGAWVGRYGELLACSWLRSRGLRVLRRNFRWGRSGEIDIVCREGGVLAFVEVKTRTRTDYGPPGRAVNAGKRRLLRIGAANWLRLLGRNVPHRFDLVEITLSPRALPRITHRRGFLPNHPPP